MRMWGLFFAAFLLTACGKSQDTGASRTPGPAETAAGASVNKPDSPDAVLKPVVPQKPAATDPRLQLLANEWSAYEDVLISHSAATLGAEEKEMLRHLLEAGRLIEELHMLQIHPDNLRWRDSLAVLGAEIEQKMFFRNQMPWCEDNENPLCTAYPAAGKKAVGRIFWPDDFDEKQYAQLSREINAKELLSPFTVVRRKSPRGYDAVPYAVFDHFGPKMRKVATALRAAAAVAPDMSLKKFLFARADAFLSLSPFPYDASDYDWIAMKGEWEVTVGPYEVYRSPFQTKAHFEMVIGREDKVLTASLLGLKDDMQSMDNALSELVGEAVYKSRILAKGIAFRAVDVWAAFGDGRHSRGAVLAYHLPNRGKSVDEGLYKKVILVNHAAAVERVTEARAALVLNPEQEVYLSFRDAITNTAFHELAHGFGAYHEMRITDLEGRLTTVKEALREYDSLLEELKADTMSLWLSGRQHEAKTLDDDSLRRRYVSAVVHLLGLLQYPPDDTYTRMSAVLLGRLIDDGAVIFDASTERSTVVFDKMGASIAALLKETATLQLTGDFPGAKALVEKYCSRGESGFYLNGNVKIIRDSVTAQFKKSTIKTPALRYEVIGLE